MSKSLLFPFLLLMGACSGETTDKATDKAATTSSQPEEATQKATVKKGRIVFFGDSLTAGYGLDEEKAYPSHIQRMVDSVGLAYEVVNAGLSGETTAGGLNRIDWMLEQPLDVLVLELGGNDALRGFNLETTRTNLQAIVEKVRDKYPEARIVIAGMEAPPNMGADYTTAFRGIYRDLAQRNELPLIPFLLEDVGGHPDLNLPDRIHPNEKGHRIVAGNVWRVLQQVL